MTDWRNCEAPVLTPGYHAITVDSVLKPEAHEPITVDVEQDGKPVAHRDARGEVHYDAPGRSYALAVLVALLLAACGPKAPQTFGYKPEAVPGISKERLLDVLGKPQESENFSIPGTSVNADVLTYPFGQVLVQKDTVVAVSINNDPAYVGPKGIKLGMAENDLRAALAHGRHTGHVETYDAISGANDTRTKDIYDDTDHMMIELTAVNPNDPFASFNIAQVTLTNHDGMLLLDAFTKARVGGLYPDVHVDNFVFGPWAQGR